VEEKNVYASIFGLTMHLRKLQLDGWFALLGCNGDCAQSGHGLRIKMRQRVGAGYDFGLTAKDRDTKCQRYPKSHRSLPFNQTEQGVFSHDCERGAAQPNQASHDKERTAIAAAIGVLYRYTQGREKVKENGSTNNS
jgi:hypothetical protein